MNRLLVLCAMTAVVLCGWTSTIAAAEAEGSTASSITFLSTSSTLALPAVGEPVEVAAAVAPAAGAVQALIDDPTPVGSVGVTCAAAPTAPDAAVAPPATSGSATGSRCTPEAGLVRVVVTATAADAAGTLVLVGEDGSVARRAVAVTSAASVGPTKDGTVKLSLSEPGDTQCVTDVPVDVTAPGVATITAMGPGGAGKIVVDPAKSCTSQGLSGTTWVLSGFESPGSYTGTLSSGSGDSATKLTVEVGRKEPLLLCIVLLLTGSLLASLLATVAAFRRITSKQDVLVDSLRAEVERFGAQVPDSLPIFKPDRFGLVDRVEALRPGLHLILPGSSRKKELAALLGPKGETYATVVAEVAKYGKLTVELQYLDRLATALEPKLDPQPAVREFGKDLEQDNIWNLVERARRDLGWTGSTAPPETSDGRRGAGDSGAELQRAPAEGEPPADRGTIQEPVEPAELERRVDLLVQQATPVVPDVQPPDRTEADDEAKALLAKYAQPTVQPRGIYARTVLRPRAAGEHRKWSDSLSWLALSGLPFLLTTAVAVGLGLVETYYKADTWGTDGELLAALMLASTLSAGFNIGRYAVLNAALNLPTVAPTEEKADS